MYADQNASESSANAETRTTSYVKHVVTMKNPTYSMITKMTSNTTSGSTVKFPRAA